MEQLTNGQFIEKMLAADAWQITEDKIMNRFLLTTLTYREESGWPVAKSEQWVAPNPMDLPYDEFVTFYRDLRATMDGFRKPRILIGYKIGDELYHPDDVEQVYAYDDAKSASDAAPAESGEGTPERKDPEGRCGNWEDAYRASLLLLARSLGEADSDHDGQEKG